MSNKFEEVKQKVLLSQYINGSFKVEGGGKRLRYSNCPLCNGRGCFDVIPPNAKNNTDGKHVSKENLNKTLLFMGNSQYERCRKNNISTIWSTKKR